MRVEHRKQLGERGRGIGYTVRGIIYGRCDERAEGEGLGIIQVIPSAQDMMEVLESGVGPEEGATSVTRAIQV